METDRYGWETYWQDIIDYCLPNRAPVIGDGTPGEDRTTKIYDSTAVRAVVNLASSLNSFITNPQTNWFLLDVDDEKLSQDLEVKQWLEQVSLILRKSLDASNFYTQIHEAYIDISSLGTAAVYIEPRFDDANYLNFSTRHIKEMFIAENRFGEVDTVFRRFSMPHRQIIQQWGKKAPKQVIDKVKDKPDEEREILHAVYPREEYNTTKKDAKNMPFASVWIDVEGKELISEGGFESFPYAVVRWTKSSGEVFGRSPALNALSDIKTLNQMMYTLLNTGNKVADPPMTVPDEGCEIEDVTPGSLLYYDARLGVKPEYMQLGSNLPVTYDMIAEMRNIVKEAFFENALRIAAKDRMTAEEIRERRTENARIIGPAFGRLMSELIDKIITRSLGILSKSVVVQKDGTTKKVLPPAPDKIIGIPFKIKYKSPITVSMKQYEANKLMQYVGYLLDVYKIKPEALDNINLDEVIREIATLSDIEPRLMRLKKDVEKIRQARYKARLDKIKQEQQLNNAVAYKERTAGERNLSMVEEKKAKTQEIGNE